MVLIKAERGSMHLCGDLMDTADKVSREFIPAAKDDNKVCSVRVGRQGCQGGGHVDTLRLEGTWTLAQSGKAAVCLAWHVVPVVQQAPSSIYTSALALTTAAPPNCTPLPLPAHSKCCSPTTA